MKKIEIEIKNPILIRIIWPVLKLFFGIKDEDLKSAFSERKNEKE